MGIKTRLLSSALILALGACAYRFSDSRAEIPGVSSHIASPYKIFVPVADNKTSNLGMETELTSALARVIAGLSNVHLVSSRDDANLILGPRVIELNRSRGLGTLLGTRETSDAGGLAQGAVTAREFKVSASVELDLFELSAQSRAAQPWVKRWTRRFDAESSFSSSLRLIPSTGSSSSSVINQSRERLAMRTLAEDVARKVREQVFQGF